MHPGWRDQKVCRQSQGSRPEIPGFFARSLPLQPSPCQASFPLHHPPMQMRNLGLLSLQVDTLWRFTDHQTESWEQTKIWSRAFLCGEAPGNFPKYRHVKTNRTSTKVLFHVREHTGHHLKSKHGSEPAPKL